MEIVNEAKELGLIAGIVVGEGVFVKPSPQELQEKLAELVEERAKQDFPSAELKQGVRDLLKRGGYKPSGRNKPASEYLAQAAREGRFPVINNLVDINNYLSLLSGLPISLLNLDVLGESGLLRTGRPGEQYTFNASGQIIEVEGLICICRGEPYPGTPLGNPVKDSMEAKITEETSQVIGVIYSPLEVVTRARLEEYGEILAGMLSLYGVAQETRVEIV